jgi:hypothetical protein
MNTTVPPHPAVFPAQLHTYWSWALAHADPDPASVAAKTRGNENILCIAISFR